MSGYNTRKKNARIEVLPENPPPPPTPPPPDVFRDILAQQETTNLCLKEMIQNQGHSVASTEKMVALLERVVRRQGRLIDLVEQSYAHVESIYEIMLRHIQSSSDEEEEEEQQQQQKRARFEEEVFALKSPKYTGGGEEPLYCDDDRPITATNPSMQLVLPPTTEQPSPI